MNRCVVIGCGWAGRHHLDTVAASAYARLAAAVEPDENKRQEAARRYGVPVYDSVESLLASGTGFDTGIVATLPALHGPQCAALIAAGKNVLCEKPVCRSSAEIAALGQAARKAGVRFGVVFNPVSYTHLLLVAALGGWLHWRGKETLATPKEE